MKNDIKKFILFITTVLSPIGSYAISGGGIAAATLGSAAAVTMVGVGVHKARHRHDQSHQQKKAEKEEKKLEKKHKHEKVKELKDKINEKKKEIKKHKNDLHNLKKRGKASTPQAAKHESIINELENDIDQIKEDIENL